jgi:hypothetical protein
VTLSCGGLDFTTKLGSTPAPKPRLTIAKMASLPSVTEPLFGRTEKNILTR